MTEIIGKIIPLSMSKNIIDIIIDESVRLGKMEVIWKEMAQDDQLKEDIRIKMEEEDKAKRQDALNKAKIKRLKTVWRMN